jgi:hypothetical protein
MTIEMIRCDRDDSLFIWVDATWRLCSPPSMVAISSLPDVT